MTHKGSQKFKVHFYINGIGKEALSKCKNTNDLNSYIKNAIEFYENNKNEQLNVFDLYYNEDYYEKEIDYLNEELKDKIDYLNEELKDKDEIINKLIHIASYYNYVSDRYKLLIDMLDNKKEKAEKYFEMFLENIDADLEDLSNSNIKLMSEKELMDSE